MIWKNKINTIEKQLILDFEPVDVERYCVKNIDNTQSSLDEFVDKINNIYSRDEWGIVIV